MSTQHRRLFICGALSAGMGRCNAPHPPVVPPPADAVTVAGQASSAADVATDAAPATHLPLVLRFVLEPRGTGGERSLILASTDGRVHETGGTIAPFHRCVVDPPQHGAHGADPRPSLGVECGLGELSARFELPGEGVQPGKLVVSGGRLSRAEPSRAVLLPEPRSLVTLDPALVDPAGGCAPVAFGDGGSPVVEVPLDRELKIEDPSQPPYPIMVLRVPSVGVEQRFEESNTAYCHGSRMPAAGRFQLDCTTAESHSTIALSVQEGVLVMQSSERSYGLSRDRAYGGVALPCGANVGLPRVHWPNPRWSPVGNCPPCQYAEDLCRDPCLERYTDERGDLTEVGRTCTDRCDAAFQRCFKACMGPM